MANTSLVRPNPALERGFERVDHGIPVATATATGTTTAPATMTISGTVGATAVFLFVLLAAGAVGWTRLGMGWAIAAIVVALGFAIYTVVRPRHAQFSGLGYAVFEGLALGAISRTYEQVYDGVVVMAVGLTVAILVGLLAVYRTGVIKVTQNFRLAVAAGVVGIMLFYAAGFVVSLLGGTMPLIHSNSTFGILFSLAVICLASASLVVDFDFIERGAEEGLPKYMEWYGAFGLMVTLVWLYLELLRLLSKLQSRE